MKKYLLLLLVPFLFLTNVKADTILDIQYEGSNYSEYYYLNNLQYNEINIYKKGIESIETIECTSREDCYNKAITYYQNSGYQYYSVEIQIYPQNNRIEFILKLFNFSNNELYYQHVYSGGNRYRFYYSNNEGIATGFYYLIIMDGWSDPYANSFYQVYDYNFNFIPGGDYAFSGFYDNENENIENMVKITSNGQIPKIKDLLEYSSWSEYEQDNLEGYTEVNLDNYEYVLLSLKDYSQTQAFQTNLQVKGQIGITPIYNYGQTSKDDVTDSQVQDRCNVNYTDYTSHPLYILSSDLTNNSIYAVKSCNSGSSFKFDNSTFNITYITSENKDNPTVTIAGHTYNVIPYDSLPSSATANEEEGYIPGESENIITGETIGLSAILKNIQQKLSEIWNIFTYFMSFVNQIFSVLPEEIRTVLVASFTIGCVLGLIKILKA